MRIYYDTEFAEDGRTIKLISIGMVAEDGRELYAVNDAIAAKPLHERVCGDPWLMEHVIPHLPLRSHTSSTFDLDLTSRVVMPRRRIRDAVAMFIADTPDPELWADYSAYDHVALAQLWGRMVDMPSGVPGWTNDFRQELHRLGNPVLPAQTGRLHHALADARYLRVSAEYLAGLQSLLV